MLSQVIKLVEKYVILFMKLGSGKLLDMVIRPALDSANNNSH